MKQCTGECQRTFTDEEAPLYFWKHSRGANGLQSVCKDCMVKVRQRSRKNLKRVDRKAGFKTVEEFQHWADTTTALQVQHLQELCQKHHI